MPESPARRRFRPLRSVRSRILATMLLVAATGMLVAGATAYLVQRDRVLAGVDDRLASAVDDAQFVASDAQATTLDGVLTALVQRLRPGTDESAFALRDSSSAIVPGGAIDFHLERDSAFVTRVLAETAAGVVRGTAQSGDRTVRYVAIPVVLDGSSESGVFVVAVDLDARLAPLTEAFRTFAIVAAVALVVVGLVGWYVSGRLLAPIRQLRETAARITENDTSERIAVSGNDDVSELTVTVNDMLDRLDSALTGQRQLLDDVGHELKTPVTIVRGHLELMNAADVNDVTATRELAIDELDRMSSLVRDISDLAGVQGTLRLRPEPTDIAALTDRVRAKAAALSSAHNWTVDARAEVIAVVDPERLTQALVQLCANAITHGAATGPIELGSAVRDGSLELWVRDHGVGIPQELQSVIFERFRRGVDGRGASGSGLGLAIVDAIARAHGGTVAVASEPGDGAAFTITLPLITASSPAPGEQQS